MHDILSININWDNYLEQCICVLSNVAHQLILMLYKLVHRVYVTPYVKLSKDKRCNRWDTGSVGDYIHMSWKCACVMALWVYLVEQLSELFVVDNPDVF